MQRPILFPVVDYRPAALGQHRAAGLGFPGAPSGTLQSVVAAPAFVLDVGQRDAQLRIPLLDPVELGWAPFALATSDAMTLWAREIDVSMHPDARLYVLPCIAGHVGADAAAVVLSESPHQQDEMMLVVDVSTNAEILLGNRDKLLACSSPTGPAFEGGQITYGMPGYDGAVESISIDGDEVTIKTIGDEFMATAGLLTPNDNPLLSAIRCGHDMVAAARETEPNWDVRVGVH